MKRKYLLSFLLTAVIILAALALPGCNNTDPTTGTTENTAGSTGEATTVPTTGSTAGTATVPTAEATVPPTTEPPIVKESTATVGATGDILLHDRVIESGWDKEAGTYNYDDIFTFFSRYASQVDYAVANLEVTLCGNDNGYAYKGYPCFNSPDAIVDALKAAGFDMLLTANNHAYDTRNTGFHRTQQVIAERGLAHIGTRPAAEDKNYAIVDVNGIQIGMINYTYNTSQDADGTVSLNGIPLTNENSQLINSFSYSQLDKFYEKLQGELDAMRSEGAEAIVMYIHWGDEYKTSPNSYQKKIAQQLCNMGIDVIVGNHAHVPQPVELLTSETDESRKTVCLYSTGNAVSNIYRGSFPINTEDGMLFTFTFAKYSDGTVVVESADVLPTWVYRYDDEDWTRKYLILTMDDSVEDWQAAMDLTDAQLAECQDSYDRTMGLVSEGLAEANEWFAANQARLEAELGIAES